MGIFSKILVSVATKKAEEVLIENAEEMKSKTKKIKKRLFSSRDEVAAFLLGYVGVTQGISVWASIIAVIANVEEINLIGRFYSTYAVAMFLSCVLFILGMIIYGLYLINFLPILIMFVSPFPFFLIPVFIEYGVADSFRFFFSGKWMPPAMKLTLFLLGIVVSVSSITIAYKNQSKGTKQETKEQVTKTVSDEEVEKNRGLLRTAIQDNAILVQFVKRKWGFTVSSKVQFGYDDENEYFVFVSNKSSTTIEAEKVVYIDYEDILYGLNSTAEYQRLIKMYYLADNNEEQIITLSQRVLEDMCDNRMKKIKQYANKYPTDEPEIVFRRKIRHLASSLEVDCYPNRPFLNDKWFEFLKATMEKVKNNNADGYTLFRNKLIANDDYWSDDALFVIIEDLSKNPPDPSSAKKEAKKLCFRDFGATLGHNIKNFFS